MAGNNLQRGKNDLQVYVMAEIPANVTLADLGCVFRSGEMRPFRQPSVPRRPPLRRAAAPTFSQACSVIRVAASRRCSVARPERSIPTPEHYLPLLYIIALCREGGGIMFPVEGIDGGSISMLAVQVG